MSRPEQPLAQRFWAKVDKTTTPDGCWTWTACEGHGYGYLLARRDGKWKRVKAAIISWEIANSRPFPQDKLLCHQCNNRICVRPDHLYAGTYTDNNRDTVKAGHNTNPKGEAHPKHKLTLDQVREIRYLYSSKEGSYRKASTSQRKLAEQFGISRRAIRSIISHKNWKESYEVK